jgi:hypothetical protein
MELFNQFNNLSFDLRDMICREVGFLKVIENTKHNHKLLMKELMNKHYDNKEIKYTLNNVYQYLEIGKRIVGETDLCYDCDMFFDKLYYDNLDYILMCDIDTEITDNEIIYHYKLKDNYSYLRNYYENWIENNDMELEELDMYELGFRYDIKSYSYELFDFVDIELDNISLELEEMIYENIDRDNDYIKILIYECSDRKVFYGKTDKNIGIMLF